MPRNDGTGPMGQGAMTGRKMGQCTGQGRMSGQQRGQGRMSGQQMGQGGMSGQQMGQGRMSGQQMGQGRMSGQQMGQGRMSGQGMQACDGSRRRQGNSQMMTGMGSARRMPSQEVMLNRQKRALELQLEAINAELESI